MPSRLLHPRTRLGQILQPRVDLGASHRDVLELTVVEPMQGDPRGVAFVTGDHGGEEAVCQAAAARQKEGGSPGQWPGSGGRDGGQYGHGCVLQ